MTTLRARDRIAQVRLRPLSMSAVTGMSTAAAIRAIAAHVSSIGAASPSAKPSVAATALLAEATAGNRQPPRHWRSRRPRRSPERAVGQAHGGSEGRPPARPTVERSWSSESPSNWRRVQFCRARRPRRCRADHSTVGGSCRRVPDRAIVASLGVGLHRPGGISSASGAWAEERRRKNFVQVSLVSIAGPAGASE